MDRWPENTTKHDNGDALEYLFAMYSCPCPNRCMNAAAVTNRKDNVDKWLEMEHCNKRIDVSALARAVKEGWTSSDSCAIDQESGTPWRQR